MPQKTVEECHRVECHGAEPLAPLGILPAAGASLLLQGHQPRRRERDPMGIAREIFSNVRGRAQGRLRLDAPCGTPERPQQALPGRRRREGRPTTGPREDALASGQLAGVQAAPPEALAQDLHREETVRATGDPPSPSRGQPPSGPDTVERRVRVEWLAPGLAHRPAADVRPKMLRGPHDVLKCRHYGAHEQAVARAGMLEAQGTADGRPRKDHMDGGDVEPLAVLGGEPGRLRSPVALGAGALATGVIAAVLVGPLSTPGRGAPQGRRPPDGDGPEGAGRCWGQGGPIARAIGGAIVLDHLSHFEGWASHKGWSSGNASSGRGGAGRACGVPWR
jgi:hypothetical protein